MHYVVTGACGGLGKEVVTQLCKTHEVTALYHNSFEEFPPQVTAIQCDLSVPGGIDFSHIKDDKIAFVHLAGVSIDKAFKGATENSPTMDFTSFEHQYRVNVLGGLKVAYLLWPKMKKVNFGRIVFIGSVTAHHPVFGTLGYAMSKSALEAAAKILSVEGLKYNIFSSCIAFGYAGYGMVSRLSEEYQQKVKENIPLGRFAQSDELVKGIEFLVSTDYMVGQTLHLNGGLYV